MERNLAMEVVRVTEAAALSCSRFMGRGDDAAADIAAVEAMRKAFEAIAINGRASQQRNWPKSNAVPSAMTKSPV